MNTISTRDGATLYYKDWGAGPAVVFSHGWPLSADAWDAQMMFFGMRGYRVIAHDRRGHGRSSQTRDGNDMNSFADETRIAKGSQEPPRDSSVIPAFMETSGRRRLTRLQEQHEHRDAHL